MREQCAPAELFPDIPTKPTDLTWDDLEWALFEDDIEPFIEAVVIRLETMLAPRLPSRRPHVRGANHAQ
jgi:hypothetical protein